MEQLEPAHVASAGLRTWVPWQEGRLVSRPSALRPTRSLMKPAAALQSCPSINCVVVAPWEGDGRRLEGAYVADAIISLLYMAGVTREVDSIMVALSRPALDSDGAVTVTVDGVTLSFRIEAVQTTIYRAGGRSTGASIDPSERLS